MEGSLLSELLKKKRKELGWTQKGVAARARVSTEEVRSIEWGRRKPKRETIKKLARALDEDPLLFLEASEPDEMVSPRGLANLPVGLALLQRSESVDLTVIGAGERPDTMVGCDTEEDERYVTDLGRLSLSVTATGLVRRDLCQLIGNYQPRQAEEAVRRILSKAYAFLALSYAEETSLSVIHLAQSYAGLASRLSNDTDEGDSHSLALWAEASLYRKEGDITRDEEKHKRALGQLVTAIERAESSVMKEFVCIEKPKVLLELGRHQKETALDEIMNSAAGLQKASMLSSLDMTGADTWVSFIERLTWAMRVDALLRTHAILGHEWTSTMEEQARGVEKLAQGLSLTIGPVTSKYSKAQMLLRCHDRQRLLEGVQLWWDAWQYARAEGFRKQVKRGEEIFERPAVRNQLKFRLSSVKGPCRICRTQTTWDYDEGGRVLGYTCSGCSTPTIAVVFR